MSRYKRSLVFAGAQLCALFNAVGAAGADFSGIINFRQGRARLPLRARST
jgi:hypothetical protein